MDAKPATAEKNGVILIRMGVGREEVILPEGATLADLLREARIEKDGQEILIDGRPLEESLVLQPGSIVTVAPGQKSDSSQPFWWRGVGMFRDDPTFEEMVKRIEARRDSERDAS